ncbi:TPA: hypothetical protein EYP66_05690 [Candidatus Poribacteria bacterium]|nr:hypothetical protein [Candidatus Poribacteria bacterium]
MDSNYGIIMTEIHGTLQLRKIIFELRFHPNLLFYDEKNQIGVELNRLYANWRTDGLQIRLTDDKTFSSLLIAHNRIVSAMDAPENFQAFKSRTLKGKKAYTDKVPINDIRRAGVRFFWICPVDFPFDELNRVIQERFYRPQKELSEVLVPEFKDVGFLFNFEKKGYSFHLQFGPVKEEEIPQRITPIQLITGEPKSFENPDVGLFYDVDCYTEEIQINDLEPFLDKGYNIVKEMVSGITKYILEV